MTVWSGRLSLLLYYDSLEMRPKLEKQEGSPDHLALYFSSPGPRLAQSLGSVSKAEGEPVWLGHADLKLHMQKAR